jgi:N-acetylmuramoyl-L-alanine amidase
MKIAMSVGHGEHIRGASGYIDEVDQAERVVQQVAVDLTNMGVHVVTYFDTVSTSQNENLERIVDWHNQQSRDLDVSVHFNAYQTTSKPMGCECLYVTQSELAGDVAFALASATDLPNRGAKYRSDLYFLNQTSKPAILIETCFVDSSVDAEHYLSRFGTVCQAIAEAISGEPYVEEPEPPEPPETEQPPLTGENRVDVVSTSRGDVTIIVNGSMVQGHEGCEHVVDLQVKLVGDVTLVVNGEEFHNKLEPEEPVDALLHVKGKCSWFGGPEDTGVAPDEGLAFIYDYADAPYLFLDQQPPGTTGLARRLDTEHVYYVACRWDYNVTPKTMLAQDTKALVRANGKEFLAWPADWGPHEDTGRVADISHALMHALGIETDDEVEVIYPATEFVS